MRVNQVSPEIKFYIVRSVTHAYRWTCMYRCTPKTIYSPLYKSALLLMFAHIIKTPIAFFKILKLMDFEEISVYT